MFLLSNFTLIRDHTPKRDQRPLIFRILAELLLPSDHLTLTELEKLSYTSRTPINNQLKAYNLCQLKTTVQFDYNPQLDYKNPIGLHFEGDMMDCNHGPLGKH